MQKFIFRLGSGFALLAVVLGAFGAHALKGQLLERDTLEVWKTAVDYQMWHALALLLIARLPLSGRAARGVPYCFGLGVLLFSGSLYWLALGGPKWLGPMTPLGGLSLIAGWLGLIVTSLKKGNLQR